MASRGQGSQEMQHWVTGVGVCSLSDLGVCLRRVGILYKKEQRCPRVHQSLDSERPMLTCMCSQQAQQLPSSPAGLKLLHQHLSI